MPEKFALILGSGFEHLIGKRSGSAPQTRFGLASGPVHEIALGDASILALARHGIPHVIPPHAINYRANLLLLQQAGATAILALNTVGVISAVRDSGEIAIPEQILDYTSGRQHTIYDGNGAPMDHIDFTVPFCEPLRSRLLAAGSRADIDCYDGGVYAVTQGPRLETAAEVDRLERDGADFVGMTAMPEAAIARELGMNYVCIALIVNRAAGRGDQPIHADLEASSQTARSQAESLLIEFLAHASRES